MSLYPSLSEASIPCSSLRNAAGSVTLASLADMQDFQSCNLASVDASLTLAPGPGVSLSPYLSSLTFVNNHLTIKSNHLHTLTGLDALETVAQDFTVTTCPLLRNLTGLDSLKEVGGKFQVDSVSRLETLAGLENLGTVGHLALFLEAVFDASAIENVTTTGQVLVSGEFRANLTSLRLLRLNPPAGSGLMLRSFPHLTELYLPSVSRTVRLLLADLDALTELRQAIHMPAATGFDTSSGLWYNHRLCQLDPLFAALSFSIGNGLGCADSLAQAGLAGPANICSLEPNYAYDGKQYFLLRTQADVAAFGARNCTKVYGNVALRATLGATISSLEPLYHLRAIAHRWTSFRPAGGSFHTFSSLEGLHNLVGGTFASLYIENDLVSSLHGLRSFQGFGILPFLPLYSKIDYLGYVAYFGTLGAGNLALHLPALAEQGAGLSLLRHAPWLTVTGGPLAALSSIFLPEVRKVDFLSLMSFPHLTSLSAPLMTSVSSPLGLTLRSLDAITGPISASTMFPSLAKSALPGGAYSQFSTGAAFNHMACGTTQETLGVPLLMANGLGCTVPNPNVCTGTHTVTSQAELQEFALLNCSKVFGALYVSGSDIASLLPLSSILEFEGTIDIKSVPLVTSLEGLHNLQGAGDGILRLDTPSVTSLHGLRALRGVTSRRSPGALEISLTLGAALETQGDGLKQLELAGRLYLAAPGSALDYLELPKAVYVAQLDLLDLPNLVDFYFPRIGNDCRLNFVRLSALRQLSTEQLPRLGSGGSTALNTVTDNLLLCNEAEVRAILPHVNYHRNGFGCAAALRVVMNNAEQTSYLATAGHPFELLAPSISFVHPSLAADVVFELVPPSKLPDGLVLNSTTGAIIGTPLEAGVFRVEALARAGTLMAATEPPVLTLTVSPPPLVVEVRQQFTQTTVGARWLNLVSVLVKGGRPPFAVLDSSGRLPPEFSLAAAGESTVATETVPGSTVVLATTEVRAVLGGVAATPGNHATNITVYDANGAARDVPLALTTHEALAVFGGDVHVTKGSHARVALPRVVGGRVSEAYAVDTQTLVLFAGMSVQYDSSKPGSSSLVGLPSDPPGVHEAVLVARDASNATVAVLINWVVAPELVVQAGDGAGLPDATANQDYEAQLPSLAVIGGRAPVQLTLLDGETLQPEPGLSIDADGVISGRPFRAGTLRLTVRAIDANGATNFSDPFTLQAAVDPSTLASADDTTTVAGASAGVSVAAVAALVAAAWLLLNKRDRQRHQKHYHVFISYRRETDKDVAEALCSALEERYSLPWHTSTDLCVRVKCFWDCADIRKGEDWRVKFMAGLQHSCLFVPLLSEAALQGRVTHYELEDAREDNMLLEFETAIQLQKQKRLSILPLLIGTRKEGPGDSGKDKSRGKLAASVETADKQSSHDGDDDLSQGSSGGLASDERPATAFERFSFENFGAHIYPDTRSRTGHSVRHTMTSLLAHNGIFLKSFCGQHLTGFPSTSSDEALGVDIAAQIHQVLLEQAWLKDPKESKCVHGMKHWHLDDKGQPFHAIQVQQLCVAPTTGMIGDNSSGAEQQVFLSLPRQPKQSSASYLQIESQGDLAKELVYDLASAKASGFASFAEEAERGIGPAQEEHDVIRAHAQRQQRQQREGAGDDAWPQQQDDPRLIQRYMKDVVTTALTNDRVSALIAETIVADAAAMPVYYLDDASLEDDPNSDTFLVQMTHDNDALTTTASENASSSRQRWVPSAMLPGAVNGLD